MLQMNTTNQQINFSICKQSLFRTTQFWGTAHASFKLKTHRVKNWRRFSTQIFGVKYWHRYSTTKTHMAEKDDDAVAAAIMHVYSFKLKQNEENVIDMYIHQFWTVYKQAKGKQWTSTNHNCFCRLRASENRPRTITRSNRSRKS